MADNTTINTGTGGDVLRTDDVGGIKIPVSKIHTGADGVDGGPITAANPLPVQITSGSQTGILIGANPVASTNPLPVSHTSGSQTGILVGANPVASTNPFPVLHTSGSQTGILIGANPVDHSNPLAVTAKSGSQTGILVGANPVATTNPLPVLTMSGSAVSLLVLNPGNFGAATPVAPTNPMPITVIADQSGQVQTGVTIRTISYAQGNFATSGSQQIVAAQGLGLRARVLSVFMMADAAVMARWLSATTQIGARTALPANGGYVLPHNPHGWFQTSGNEALNLDLSAAVNVGVIVTWIIAA